MKWLYPHLVILTLFVFISCKEEVIVEQKNENNTTPSLLFKGSDQLSVQLDTTIFKENSEKVKRLKKEHEKPYIIINKPEKILSDLLKSRNKINTLSKTPNNSSSYSTQNIQSCYTIEIEVWALEKYHSKSGFNVGIYPKNDWMYNSSTLASLKNVWAFSLIMLERMAFLNPIVYPDNQIVAGIELQRPQLVLDSYRNFLSQQGRQQFYGFYGDEPWHYIVPGIRDSISKTIYNLKYIAGFTSSKYIGGETCEGWATNFDDLVDFINCTSYTDMTYTPSYGCYRGLWDEDDQRDEWTQFNNSFGNKFNHLWISGELDRGEMNNLIGHAKNMAKNSIWLYAGEMGMSNQSYWDAIAEFDYYAFLHGYIKREERKFIYVYYYIGYDDPCFDYQVTSWELGNIIDTGVTIIYQ